MSCGFSIGSSRAEWFTSGLVSGRDSIVVGARVPYAFLLEESDKLGCHAGVNLV